jgi:glyoxylase-like metal-dependent hydrolase (beta-lactamase superfamily II)
MPRRRPVAVVAILSLGSVCVTFAAGGAQSTPAAASAIETVQVRPNVYMLAGGGGNVVVQLGSDGAMVVDAGAAGSAEALLAAIRRLTDKPIRYIINTSADADHVGGNAALSKAGRSIFQIGSNLAVAMTNGGAAGIIAYETVLFRMSGRGGDASPFPAAAWPTDTHAQPRRGLYLNDEGVEFLHQPAAHSDGDMAIFFRRSDVIAAGDIIDTTRFPVIDVARGGTIDGELAALNRLVELAIPSIPFVWKTGGTYVVPGHGRVYSQADVVNYRDMVSIIRDRVRDLLRQGMTLAQIQGASPAQGYAAAFGADTGDWTTSRFIEAIVKTSSGRAR